MMFVDLKGNFEGKKVSVCRRDNKMPAGFVWNRSMDYIAVISAQKKY